MSIIFFFHFMLNATHACLQIFKSSSLQGLSVRSAVCILSHLRNASSGRDVPYYTITMKCPPNPTNYSVPFGTDCVIVPLCPLCASITSTVLSCRATTVHCSTLAIVLCVPHINEPLGLVHTLRLP